MSHSRTTWTCKFTIVLRATEEHSSSPLLHEHLTVQGSTRFDLHRPNAYVGAEKGLWASGILSLPHQVGKYSHLSLIPSLDEYWPWQPLCRVPGTQTRNGRL